MMDEEDIALVSTDVLIEELKNRHPDGCIVALHHPPHEIRSSGTDWRVCFKGCQLKTLKLANMALWMHKDEFMGK